MSESKAPLTGAELDDIEARWSRYTALRDEASMEISVHDVPDLLAEVDRLRAELAALPDLDTIRRIEKERGSWGMQLSDARRELAETRTGRDEARADLAEWERAHREFTAELGFGNGVTEPAASLADMLEPVAGAFSAARDHDGCPVYCELCGERLADTPCGPCKGSGCGPGTASGAYEECPDCAGAGLIHEGCVEKSYAELAEMMRRPGALAIQLAEIGGMVGYPDPAGIVEAVRSELGRLRTEVAEARSAALDTAEELGTARVELVETRDRYQSICNRAAELDDICAGVERERDALVAALAAVWEAVKPSQAEQAVLDTVQDLVAAALGETGGTE